MTNDTFINAEHTSGYRLWRQRRILVAILIASFALDFKGSAGGGVVQALMAGLNLIAFALLATSYRLALPRRGLGAFVFWGWMLFLLTGTMGALVNIISFGHYIRIIYPFALFLEGFLVSWWVARSPNDAGTVVSIMVAVAVVSMIFTVWWGFHFTGDNVEGIRYQILSPLIPLLIVVTGYDLFFSRRRKLRALIWLVISFGVIALSVTRGEILMVGFVAGIVMMATLFNLIRSGSIPRPYLRAAAGALVLSAFGIMIIYISNQDILARWLQRSVESGSDTSFWTRLAAIIGQYQALTSDSIGWLIGQGFGSSYPWPIYLFPWALKFMGPYAIGHSAWFPGEFMWMSFLFYGGFFIGSIAALLLLVAAVRSFHLLGALLRTQSWRNPQVRPLWVGLLGYFAFLGMGFTANPFILRLAPLFMGLCLGLVVTQGGILIQRRMTH